MFCYNCGKEVPEGAAFCANCGAAANGQPAAAAPAVPAAPAATEVPAAPAAPVATKPAVPAMLTSFLAILKGVFSKDVVKTVGAQAKNTGNDWIISVVISVLTFALALAVNVLEGVNALVNTLLSSAAGAMGAMGGMVSQAKGMVMKAISYPFFSFFGAGLLVGVVTLAAVVAGIWLLTKLVAKKNVSWICVLNLVATATLPLSACYVANMLLGLIWFPLPILVSVVALCMSVVLLYVGFQKLEKPAVSPFYPYTAMIAAVAIVAFGVGALVLGGVLEGWVADIMATVGGMVGDSLDIFGNLF